MQIVYILCALQHHFLCNCRMNRPQKLTYTNINAKQKGQMLILVS